VLRDLAAEAAQRNALLGLVGSGGAGAVVVPEAAGPGFVPALAPASRWTSSAVMRPPGPVPRTASSAIPSCFASARTAGAASTRPDDPGAVPTAVAGAGAALEDAACAVACPRAPALAGALAASPATAIETMTVPTGTT